MHHPTLIAAGLATLLSLPVQAARPLQTDDAGVLAPADCELEAASLRQLAGGERSTQSGLQVGCGIGWNTQLAWTASTAKDAGMRNTGLALVGKHGLWQAEAGDGHALALSWQIAEARRPGGTWHHEGSELRLIGTRPLNDRLSLHGNVGHAHKVQGRIHSTTWGLALEHVPLAAVPGLAPMAEVYGDDREAAWWNLGLRHALIAEKLSIDASYGRQINHSRPSLLTIGLKFAF